MKRKPLIVPLKLCRCPKCRSTNIKTTRTISSTSEMHSQWKRCRTCRTAFITVAD
jgi:hypothetical protein